VTAGRRARSTGMRTACLTVLLALALAACGDERPASPAPDPDTPVSSSGDLDTAAPATPVRPAPGCKRLGKALVGVGLEAAQVRADERRCTLRVAELDGEPQMLTEDYSPARINVKVRGGVVRAVAFMG